MTLVKRILLLLGFFKSDNKNKTMINLILFGPPGSGKGTQAAKLVDKYGLVHISTGDLFRFEIGNKTPLGIEASSYMDKGQLVPDAVTIGMLKNRVSRETNAKGFIFDGFPRTVAQAEALDAYLSEEGQNITKLIALSVEKNEIIQRLLRRGKTSGRPDDQNEEVITKRINEYLAKTKVVYDFYDKQSKASTVEGKGSIEDIFTALSEEIDCI